LLYDSTTDAQYEIMLGKEWERFEPEGSGVHDAQNLLLASRIPLQWAAPLCFFFVPVHSLAHELYQLSSLLQIELL
jgi:hypothetical protein